jgi:hypothetical protein
MCDVVTVGGEDVVGEPPRGELALQLVIKGVDEGEKGGDGVGHAGRVAGDVPVHEWILTPTTSSPSSQMERLRSGEHLRPRRRRRLWGPAQAPEPTHHRRHLLLDAGDDLVV